MTYMLWALAAVVLLIVAVALYASTRPDAFSVSRSIDIAAPPENIFPFINEIRTFDTWNPFAKQKGMELAYSGPPAGAGASNRFSGPGATGSLTITGCVPSSEVTMQLVMEKPIKGNNHIAFTIVPAAQGTKVTWAMSGKNNFIGKVIQTFVSMDRMCGGEFEKGLRDLKALAEK